ncbi:bifunctional hydroxymethylpyrimidine kinase/phosphomethylpyrimidine kinase [Candidatus Acetothermia bacterium]|nr:bifunctional hydroxymethylpyrimidine kinase/phosphomethylpyrimidine kinase [Candidatus Acetothermia bacterium]
MTSNGVLTIAGSDSSGGAGIQTDLKTIEAFGQRGMTAITALTAQNSRGVSQVFPVPPDMVVAQISKGMEDGVAAVKIGMLAEEQIVEAVAAALADYRGPIVLDPVLIAGTGERLLTAGAVKSLLDNLFPRASIVTPNIPEVEEILRNKIIDDDHLRCAGEKILQLGPSSVLLKGGHLKGESVVDLLRTSSNEYRFTRRRLTGNYHGAGCTLASAIACGLASGKDIPSAVAQAAEWIDRILAYPRQVGRRAFLDPLIVLRNNSEKAALFTAARQEIERLKEAQAMRLMLKTGSELAIATRYLCRDDDVISLCIDQDGAIAFPIFGIVCPIEELLLTIRKFDHRVHAAIRVSRIAEIGVIGQRLNLISIQSDDAAMHRKKRTPGEELPNRSIEQQLAGCPSTPDLWIETDVITVLGQNISDLIDKVIAISKQIEQIDL